MPPQPQMRPQMMAQPGMMPMAGQPQQQPILAQQMPPQQVSNANVQLDPFGA